MHGLISIAIQKGISHLHPTRKAVKLFQDWIRSREIILIGSLVGAVVMAGVVYSNIQGDILRFPDERDYVTLARSIASHESYTLNGTDPTAYRPPGYPFLLALFVYLGMSVVELRILNYLFFGLTIVLLARIVRRIGDPIAGAFSAIMMALHGALFYSAGTVLPQIFAIFWLLLTIDLIVSANRTLLRTLFAGFATGAHLLTNPSSIFLLLPFSAWFIWRDGLRAGTPHVGMLIIGTALVVAPWTIRNYAAFDSVVPISTNSGLNLLLGNNENSTPDSGADVDIDRYRLMAKGMNEARTDSLFFKEAVAYIQANRLHVAQMYLQKFLRYFGFGTEVRTSGESRPVYRILMLLTYGPILILLLLRLSLLHKFAPTPPEVLFLSIFLASGLFFSIFFVRLRFRLPFDTLMIGVVAMFLSSVVQRFEAVTLGRSATPASESS